jgi:hypothetical protein
MPHPTCGADRTHQPGGTLLATASNDSMVRLWHVTDGTEHTMLSGHN